MPKVLNLVWTITLVARAFLHSQFALCSSKKDAEEFHFVNQDSRQRVIFIHRKWTFSVTVISDSIQIKSKKENDMMDITQMVAEKITQSKLKDGIVTVFVSGSTAALTTIEYEPGLQKDFPKALSRIAPDDIEYGHEQMWHDGNGRSHVKASLVGPSITIPFTDGEMTLGTWQQVVLVELDTRPRSRSLVVQMIGE